MYEAGANRFMVEIIFNSRGTGLLESILKNIFSTSGIWFFAVQGSACRDRRSVGKVVCVRCVRRNLIIQTEKEAANETIQMYRFRRDDPVDSVNL